MRRNLKLLPALFLSLSLAMSSLSAWAAVKSGSPAPDFTLVGHDGKNYKLSDFKGKHVVLEWFNDGCPYVKKHYGSKNMQNLQKQFAEKNVVWFTVVSSAPGKQGHLDQAGATKMMNDQGMHARAMLLDPKGEVGTLYGAKTTPHMYIVNPTGQLVYQGAIDDQPSANQDSLKGAKPLFADALNASLSGQKIAKDTTTPYGCSVKYQ